MSNKGNTPGGGKDSSNVLKDNPYVGLRPFEVDESLLFFGRTEQILQLLEQLHKHHFVAVVGSSGCGKSSLLRAGVIPALKAGYLIQESDRWSINIMRPGQSPMRNLIESLLSENGKDADSAVVSKLLAQIAEEGIAPITHLLNEYHDSDELNYFLLVDQFEEIFRFVIDSESSDRIDEAIEFVNIILELSSQKRLPIFVMITMRSDFIGDCTRFNGLPEAMNESLFLVPKLTRVQMKMAIEGPARLYGGKLNPALVSRLLNELNNVEDQLPLLQHALMRIWDHEMKVDQSGSLDLTDFDFIGGIENALAKHADEALEQMSQEDVELAKELFQALTTVDENGRKTRRPVLLSQLVKSTGAKKEQLLKIIDRFIEDKRSFLIVNKAADTNDSLIDISHESLIRKWKRLNTWMDEEAESAAHYLRLAAYTQAHLEGQKDYLSGVELDILRAWRQEFKPVAAWANRYKDGFEECMTYLNRSAEEQADLIRRERMAKRKQRRMVAGLIALLFIAGITTMSTFIYKTWSDQDKKLARSMELFARERDSLAQIAINERDDAVEQLRLLEGAQDSVQKIITEIPNADENTRNKLNNVSEQLSTVIQSSERDIRRKELQLKISKEAGNTRVIMETLQSVSLNRIRELSPEELVNAFYYLNRTEKSAWTPNMLDEATRILITLDQAINEKKIAPGPQATSEIRSFQKFITDLEMDMKVQYSKKGS